MKILINISDEKINELAMEIYPEMVRSDYCCNGFECGCHGMPEPESSKAVEQLEKDILEDSDYFIEFLTEYEGDYTIKEVFND